MAHGRAMTIAAETQRRALASGIAAYAIWGIFPIYFMALAHVPAFEILADRVVASLAVMIALIVFAGDWPALFRAIGTPRILLALTASAIAIGSNWLVYVNATIHGYILAASMGYFLNPLVNVALGVLFLRERLRPVQVAAVTLAALGVAIMAAAAWSSLWISLVLAISFGLYGFIRKLAPVGASVGLTVETLVLTPLALGYIVYAQRQGILVFGQDWLNSLLLTGLGVITCFPLILFAIAARHLRLTTLGLLQYMTPTMLFLIGWGLYGESLNPQKMASFALIWTSLAIFGWDASRQRGSNTPPAQK